MKNRAFYDETWCMARLVINKFLRVSATPEMHLEVRHLEFQNGDLFPCKTC